MNYKTSRIGLIGATGKAGSVILSELLQNNHKVIILVRDPSRLTIKYNENLSIIVGDATDALKIDGLVRNADIIIDASNARKGEPPITKIVTNHLIAHMERSQKRLFVLAGKTVENESDRFSVLTLFERFLLSLLFPDIVRGKAESLNLLKESSINWTMVRCPFIVDNDSMDFHLSEERCKGKTISKKSIAAFILDEIKKEQFIFKAPFIYN